MKILLVGAGAIGGYFGGRLFEKGEDVTFLVRKNRKQQLEQNGLQIKSVHGDFSFNPKLLLAEEQADSFDVILISTKAYHLEGAIKDIKPFVGAGTIILPLLNGMAHMGELVSAFGDDRVIGGLCFIETTLDETGAVVQTSPIHDLVFGERNGEQTERILKLQEAFEGTKANFRLSENIIREMWHKYLFISTLSGVTSLFRAPIGPIRDEQYGLKTIVRAISEISGIMRSINAPLAEQVEQMQLDRIHQLGYGMKSSLQRDMEKSLPVEGDHFFGYLLKVAEENGIEAPTVQTIFGNLKIYEKMLMPSH